MAPPSSSHSHGRGRSCSEIGILIVDEEPSFRSGLAALLRDDAHVVHDVAPDELPPLDDLHWVAVVVAGMRTAGEAGIAFADRFHGAHPECPVVLVTPYRTQTLDAQAASRGFLHVLDTPVDYDDLHARLHDMAR